MENLDEQKIFRKLMQVLRSIKEIYNALINYEVSDSSDDKYYQKLKKDLEKLILEESQIYYLLNSDLETLENILLRLLNDEEYEFRDVLEIVKNNRLLKMIKYRGAGVINQIDQENFYPLDYENEENEENEDEEENVIDADYIMAVNQKISTALEFDLVNTILYFLEEYISNPQYQNIRSNLIRMKYDLIFSFKSVERNLLASDYQVPSKLYWYSNIVFENYREKLRGKYDNYRESFASEILFQQLSFLEDIYLEDITNPKLYGHLIFCEILIRIAKSICASEVIIADFEFNLHYLMELIQDNNPLLYNMLEQIFNHPEDKQKINILKLNLDNDKKE